MLVARIANTRFSRPQENTQYKNHSRYKSVSFCADNFVPSSTVEPIIYANSLSQAEQELLRFPKDIGYRIKLLANAGLSDVDYKSIRSILGPSEIQSTIKGYDNHEEYYYAGENGQNPESCQASPHIHTTASDGAYDIQTLLDDAAAHANKIMSRHGKSFVIAITDHDTVRGTREAIRIIAQNPDKYRNLRVILGIEFTTYDNILPNVLRKPKNIDILAYGIDPNEQNLVEFIRKTKIYKRNIAQKHIRMANGIYRRTFKTEENPFNLQQAEKLYTPVERGILETHRFVESYVEIKLLLKEVVLKNQELGEKLRGQNPNLNDHELVNKLIDEITHFYRPIDHNAKKYGGKKTLCTFLSQKLSMDKLKITQIIDEGVSSGKTKTFMETLKAMFNHYKTVKIASHKEIPDMRDINDALKSQKRVVLGIAHPLKYLKRIREENHKTFLIDLYYKFKKTCARNAFFSEVYYQSYVDGPAEVSKKDSIKLLLNSLSERCSLFRTGGFDCHGSFLFARHFKK